LNEEKLCQLLANQTRAREKALQQTVTARPQRVAAAQAQHQTSVMPVPTHRANHAQRAPSSKSALRKPTVTPLAQSVLPTATAMTARRAPTTVVVARHMATAMAQLVQSALPMATAMTAHRAPVTAIHAQATETAMTAEHVAASVQHMVAQVQQRVVATVAK
jgi:hypothetical protein